MKRRKKVNYFFGRGQKNWVPKQELLVDKVDITSALKKFRKTSVKEAEKGKGLNNLRILSLSHIFSINKVNKDKCVAEYSREDEKKALKKLAKANEPQIPSSPSQAILYCKDIVDGSVFKTIIKRIKKKV